MHLVTHSPARAHLDRVTLRRSRRGGSRAPFSPGWGRTCPLPTPHRLSGVWSWSVEVGGSWDGGMGTRCSTIPTWATPRCRGPASGTRLRTSHPGLGTPRGEVRPQYPCGMQGDRAGGLRFVSLVDASLAILGMPPAAIHPLRSLTSPPIGFWQGRYVPVFSGVGWWRVVTPHRWLGTSSGRLNPEYPHFYIMAITVGGNGYHPCAPRGGVGATVAKWGAIYCGWPQYPPCFGKGGKGWRPCCGTWGSLSGCASGLGGRDSPSDSQWVGAYLPTLLRGWWLTPRPHAPPHTKTGTTVEGLPRTVPARPPSRPPACSPAAAARPPVPAPPAAASCPLPALPGVLAHADPSGPAHALPLGAHRSRGVTWNPLWVECPVVGRRFPVRQGGRGGGQGVWGIRSRRPRGCISAVAGGRCTR